MAQTYKTGLIITGDASGGIRAIKATDNELSKLNQGFDRGSRRSKQFSQDVNDTSRGLDVLKASAGGVAAAMATAFGAGSIINQARIIADTDSLAKSIGMATGELQAWDYAAKQAGLAGGQMGDILKDITERIGEFTAEGTGEAAALFENLNLNIEEMKRLAPDQQLLRIADAISTLETRGEQISYLERLGSDATLLLPLLDNNAAKLREFTSEAQALGVAMSQVDIDNAIEANRAMSQLTGTMEGFTNQIVADLGPGLASAVGGLSDLIQEAGGADAILDDVKDVATVLAALMAGRYAGAFAVATGAKLAATQQAVLYQGALARMAGVSATAASGQMALAGATRIATGAMTLLGGPIGLLVGAGGLMYMFREELGLVQPEIEASANRVAELTGSLDAMSRAVVQNRIADLTADLQTLKTSFIEVTEVGTAADGGMISGSGVLGIAAGELGRQARAIQSAKDGLVQGVHSPETLAEIKAHEEALANLETQFESLGTSAITVPPIIRDNDKAAKAAAKAAEEQANALQALQQEMDPLLADHANYIERMEVLDQALSDNTLTQEQYGESVRWAAEQYTRAATGAEDYEKQTEALINTYDRHNQRAAELQNALSDMGERYRAGVITGEQYVRMVGSIRDEMQQLALEADPISKELARSWEEAANRINETFADGFTGAYDSFGEFEDKLLDGFKRLMGELAYQATFEPIVIGFTTDMRGALGIPGASGQSNGGFDFSNTLSAGRNLWKAGSSLFGGGAAASGSLAMQGGLSSAALASASQVASGAAYSGAVGSAASGAALGNVASTGMMSSITSSLSAAMPWLAGGFAIDNMLGLGITDGITKAISGLFGGSPTKFSGRFGTTGTNDPSQYASSGKDGVFEHQDSGTNFYGQSALGYTGFLDRGTERLQRAGQGEGKGWAEEVTAAAVARDNAVASLARTTEEIEAMQAVVQGLEASSGNAAELIEFALNERPRAALEALGGHFGEFVRGLEGGLESVVQQAQVAQQAHSLLSGGMERLNLQFDASTAGSYAAAGALAQHLGGVEQITAINDAYYNAAFSDQERLQNQYDDVRNALNGLTDEAPRTVAELRALVEAQSQNGAASAQLAYDLMALAPALRETNAAVRQAIEQQYQDALGRGPESAGMDYWFNQVAAGALTLEQALGSIAGSMEAAIRDVYRTQLGREGDADGVNYWIGQVESGALTLEQALWHIATSAEDAGQAADNATGGLDSLKNGVSSAFNDLDRLVQAEQRAITEAHNTRIRGIDAEMQAIQSGISETESLANTLNSALNSMQSDAIASQQMQRQQAQAQVSTALALARMTGSVSMSRELEDALRIVSEPSESLFGSFRDYQRDFYRTANEIAALESLTDEQLTADELQLTELQRQRDMWERQHNAEIERYDRMISSAETQVNTLLGIGASVDNIPAALDALEAAMKGYSNAGGGSTGSAGGGSAVGVDVEQTIRAAYSKILQRSVSDADIEYWSGVGLTGADLARAIAHTGYREGSQHAAAWWSQYGEMDNLPGFKEGGIANGPMSGYPVIMHGRELITPLDNGPIPFELHGGESGNNPLLQELQRQTQKLEVMERELSELRSINVAIVEHNAKLARETERLRRKNEMEGS